MILLIQTSIYSDRGLNKKQYRPYIDVYIKSCMHVGILQQKQNYFYNGKIKHGIFLIFKFVLLHIPYSGTSIAIQHLYCKYNII